MRRHQALAMVCVALLRALPLARARTGTAHTALKSLQVGDFYAVPQDKANMHAAGESGPLMELLQGSNAQPKTAADVNAGYGSMCMFLCLVLCCVLCFIPLGGFVGMVCSNVVMLSIVIYVALFTPILERFTAGEPLGFWCKTLCIVPLVYTGFSVLCCGCCMITMFFLGFELDDITSVDKAKQRYNTALGDYLVTQDANSRRARLNLGEQHPQSRAAVDEEAWGSGAGAPHGIQAPAQPT